MTTPDPFTLEVESFLEKYINSVEQLEVLLIMERDETKCWQLPELSVALYSSEFSMAVRLGDLCKRGLLERCPGEPERYQYSPKSETLRATVKAVGTAYAERRLRVIQKIFSKPTDGVRAFSDAFRLRKDGDG